MSIPLYIVDSFASKPFSGNPAAVCLLLEKQPHTDEWMQAVANEMNLSETAFVVSQAEGYGLRWFTPAVEVDLCGHATLATAHVLWETGKLSGDKSAVFWTRSGRLTCIRAQQRIEMDFPAEPASEVAAPAELLAGLTVQPVFVGRNRMDYIVQLESEQAVRQLAPDIAELEKLPVRGVIVTAKASGDCDFISRFFAPRCGVPEDPVCGSAHCCLGPFWSERLSKTKLIAHQASRRGGVIHVHCAGDRVSLGGQAVITMRGELVV